jgi:hypothetical protein
MCGFRAASVPARDPDMFDDVRKQARYRHIATRLQQVSFNDQKASSGKAMIDCAPADSAAASPLTCGNMRPAKKSATAI